ncbi:MAG: hypothetical protein ACRERC_01490, partial [Candidatus Binatia bacterium]
VGIRIMLLVDAARGLLLPLGTASGPEVIFAQLDAVDGTIKVGGLGNDPGGAAVRVANDGNWGVTFAFTAPTRLAVEALAYRDFAVAVVVDGNPPQHRAAPREVVVLPDAQGDAVALDVGDLPAVTAALRRAPRVYTSTAEGLDQTLVYLDGFQAHDRETRQPGDEALATALYDRLLARHDGGAFDITRSYGNLSAILRVMLGWRGAPPWHESQGGGFVVINENLPNLIPSVPIVAAAGGTSIDLDGRPLLTRRLSEGRTSVVHAANPALRRQLLTLVAAARRSV